MAATDVRRVNPVPLPGPAGAAGKFPNQLRVLGPLTFSRPDWRRLKRMTPTACPIWCHTTHAEGESEPTMHYGPHWPPLRGEDGFSADVAAVQNENGNVGVWLPADHKEYLTTAQARSVARALLAASDWVDANRNT